MKYKSQRGKNEKQTSQIRWILASVFYFPAIFLVFVGKLILSIADILLFDTHHFELKISPKK